MTLKEVVSEEKKEARQAAIDATVERHVSELRKLYDDGKLTGEEHDTIGVLMGFVSGRLINLSDTGWETFKRLIQESRVVNEQHRI